MKTGSKEDRQAEEVDRQADRQANRQVDRQASRDSSRTGKKWRQTDIDRQINEKKINRYIDR